MLYLTTLEVRGGLNLSRWLSLKVILDPSADIRLIRKPTINLVRQIGTDVPLQIKRDMFKCTLLPTFPSQPGDTRPA